MKLNGIILLLLNILNSHSYQPLIPYSTNYDLICGKWIIDGSKTKIEINTNEIIAYEGVSEIVLTPKIINNNPLTLHLNSLNIRKYPDKLNLNSLKALKWINKIRIHGIDIEIEKVEEPLSIKWSVLNKKGSCYLIKDNFNKF